MKKIFFAVLMLCTMVFTANAQTDVEIQKSQERAEKLQALCTDYKVSGVESIDGYGNAIKNAAILAIANSEQLENLYKREIGKTEDGVTDVTVKKPTMEEWVALATTIGGEAACIKEATDKLKAASDECKNMSEEASKQKNPMKAAKSAKKVKLATAVIEFGNVATPILIEESAAQVAAVKNIIETLKSGKNL